MRVDSADVTYHAAMMTWLAAKNGSRFPEDQLVLLRTMTREQLAERKLASGRPPLHLREARLAASVTALRPNVLPALIQTDDASPGFGPWAVVVSRDDRSLVILDPKAGRLTLPPAIVDNHLTAVVVPYFDPEGLTGLKPLDRGDRVLALQRRLANAGLYAIEPSGLFDALTEAAVERYRQRVGLPGRLEIDGLLALRLLGEERGEE
jgi:hypothetical protein